MASARATTDVEASTTLRWAVTEPAGITPDTVIDESGILIVDLLFDSLTAIAPDGTAVPSLASSWISQDSGRRWVFTLAEDRFHDGTAVTAEDVMRGWEAAVAAGRPQLHDVVGYREVRLGTADTLEGVTAVDERTLAVELVRRDATFPLTVAHPSLAPLPPPHQLEPGVAPQSLSDHPPSDNPLGNGPFAMAEPWARGRFVRLRRVDVAQEGGSGDVQEVVFQMTDPATAYVRFQQGRVDVSPIPGGALAEAVAVYGMAADGTSQPGIHTDPRPGLVYLGVNTERAPLDDVAVRRAVSLSIDRSELRRRVAEGNVATARSLVPPAIPGDARTACTACQRAVGEAQGVFEDLDVTSLELVHEATPGDELVAELLRADLEEAGVDLVTRALSFPDLLTALERGDTDLYLFGWSTEAPAPHAAIEPLVSGSPQPGVNVNYGGYANAEVDRLLAEARGSLDARRRSALVAAAEDIALGEDQAVIPLYTTNARLAVSDRVRGLAVSAYREVDLGGVRLR